jgi:hypothetical protein
MKIKPKVRGTGRITHTCSICQKPAPDAVLRTIDGRLVALCPTHQEVLTNGR